MNVKSNLILTSGFFCCLPSGCLIVGLHIPTKVYYSGVEYKGSKEFDLDCTNSSGNGVENFMAGGSAPDIFKEFKMHDLTYAGYQLLYAMNRTISKNESFEFVEFSRGYGSHLVADMVGHHSNGYLTPSFDHELEFAVDTFNVKSFGGTAQSEFAFAEVPLQAPAIIQSAAEYYASSHTSFNPPSLEAIEGAIISFQNKTTVEAALIWLNFLYKSEMVKWDNYGAKVWEDAHTNYELARNCASDSITYWLSLFEKNVSPEDAAEMTSKHIDSLFVGGNCTPITKS